MSTLRHRVRDLERHTPSVSSVAVVFCEIGETSEQASARYVATHGVGALDVDTLIVVEFVAPPRRDAPSGTRVAEEVLR